MTTNPWQGGIALLWEADHQDFEVEAIQVLSPNLLTFQLVTGGGCFFVLGAYIPPADTTEVDDLRAAWASCPMSCKLLLLGGLNFVLRNPRSEQEEIIADFVDDINVVDMSRKFWQQMGRQQGPGVRLTWRQRRGGRWYHSQPDYCLAREGDVKLLQNAAFQQPWMHGSDHHAVVLSILRGQEDQDELTWLFGDVRDTYAKEVQAWRKYTDWISPGTWHLINHPSMLCRSGCLEQRDGWRLDRRIQAFLKQDQIDCVACVGSNIEAELARGDVQEAFHHLKGWYRAATETQAKPCYLTMERQASERVDLYTRRQSPGDPLPINAPPRGNQRWHPIGWQDQACG